MQNILSQAGRPDLCPQIIFIKNGKFLAGYRHYKLMSVWTTPGGRSEEGETLEQSLRREVAEEIGVDDFQIIDYLGTFKGSYKDDQVPVFVGVTNQEPIIMEPEKFSEWKYVTLNEVRDRFNSKDNHELMSALESLLSNKK